MMFKLPSFLTGSVWKLAFGGATIVGLVLSALLLASYFENRSLTSQRDTLAAQINDPETGYIAQLAQSRTNVAQLQTALDRQNVAYLKLQDDSRAALDAANTKLAAAQAHSRKMERQLGQFLSTKPQGATLEERIWDIDRRAMKELVP
jgi:hypothetical protein